MRQVLLSVLVYLTFNSVKSHPQSQDHDDLPEFERKLYPEPYHQPSKPFIMPRPPVDRFQHNPFLAGFKQDNHEMHQPFDKNHHSPHHQTDFEIHRNPNNGNNMAFVHHDMSENHNIIRPNQEENQNMESFGENNMNVNHNDFKPVSVLPGRNITNVNSEQVDEKSSVTDNGSNLQTTTNTNISEDSERTDHNNNQLITDHQVKLFQQSLIDHGVRIPYERVEENEQVNVKNETDIKTDDKIVFLNDERDESQNPVTTEPPTRMVDSSNFEVTTPKKVEIVLFNLANVRSNCKTDNIGKCREEYS